MTYSITVDVTRTYTSKPSKESNGSINNALVTRVSINTPTDLANLVANKNGARTWSPSVFEGGRSNANWRAASIVALDFDGGVTPQEVTDMLGVYNVVPSLIYATFSDSPELRKFRVVLFLDEEISNRDSYTTIIRGLMQVVNETADKACKDVCRMWFGGKDVVLVNDEAITNTKVLLTQMIALVPSNSIGISTNGAKGIVQERKAYNEGVVANSSLNVAIDRVKVLQDVQNGKWLSHQEIFGIATNLIWIEGGIAWLIDMMNKCGQYNANNYKAIDSVIANQYHPAKLESFSTHTDDWSLCNCVYAGMAVDYSLHQGNKYVINAPDDCVYVSDFLSTLPNGILNKKECGCGATHLMLTNIEQVVVAVPLVEMIHNKMAQLNVGGVEYIFGVYGGITKDDFMSWAKVTPILKVMVTYDSLPKVTEWLKELGQLHLTSLTIDEYHKLLTAYSYREPAAIGLLKTVALYSKVTYLSATPIAPKYAPMELIGLDYTEIVWKDAIRVKPVLKKTNKPFQAAVNMMLAHKAADYNTGCNGTFAKELYFFVNSVTAIKDMIDAAGLTNSEVKVVCSDTSTNRSTLGTLDISRALDVNKPFTFVTSKAFEGCDFYSKSGLCIVVSNVTRSNTVYDVATDIFQIAGRLRNRENPFKHTIIHIFNTGSNEISKEEFEAIVQEKIENTKIIAETYNDFDALKKKAFVKKLRLDIKSIEGSSDDYLYYNEEIDEFEYNATRVLNERYRYEIASDIYKNGISLRNAYAAGGFDVRGQSSWAMIDEEYVSNATRRSFEDVCKQYVSDVAEGVNVDRLEREHPILGTVLATLGIDAFSACNYREKPLKQELFNESKEVKDLMLSRLTKKFKSGEFYSAAFIKDVLSTLFTEFGVTKSAKATTLGEYLDLDQETKRIDGKLVKGFTIKYKRTNPF